MRLWFGRLGVFVFGVALATASISTAADTYIRWWKTGDVQHPTEPYAPIGAGTFSTSPVGVPAGANVTVSGSGKDFSWGTWTGSFTRTGPGDTITSNNPGDWIEGLRTLNGNLPSTGTKTITGKVHGSIRDSDNDGNALAFNRLGGSFTLTLDFGAGTVTGKVNNLVRIKSGGVTEPWMDDIDIDAEIFGLYGDGHFDSYSDSFDGLSKSGFLKETIGGLLQGFLFGNDYAEMGCEFSLYDKSSPNGETRAQGFLVSDPVPEPRLFGIMIGQNDRVLEGSNKGVRGNKGAQAVFDLLSDQESWAAANEGNPSTIIEFFESRRPDVIDLIIDQLDAMQVRTGDTFVFYYCGHGGQWWTREGDPDPSNEEPDGQGDTADEFLSCGLTDDDLYRIFSESKWAGVRKVFFLDTCHGGGFLGNFSDDDVGDLEKLGNYALFASSTEEGTAQSKAHLFDNDDVDPDGGMGVWTYEHLLKVLAYQIADISGDSLVNHYNTHVEATVQKYEGQLLPLLEENLNPPGSTAVFDGLDMVYGFSPDFDMSKSMIPKVATAAQPPVAPPANTALRTSLAKKIKKLAKKAKSAKKKGQSGKAKKLQKKVKKLQQQLRSL